VVSYDIWPMRCTNYIHEVNEWYILHFYKFIFYCLFGWSTSIHCYLGGAHLTFDAGARDFKEALVVGASQEVLFFTIAFGVFGICDRWRRVEDGFFQGGDAKTRMEHLFLLFKSCLQMSMVIDGNYVSIKQLNCIVAYCIIWNIMN